MTITVTAIKIEVEPRVDALGEITGAIFWLGSVDVTEGLREMYGERWYDDMVKELKRGGAGGYFNPDYQYDSWKDMKAERETA